MNSPFTGMNRRFIPLSFQFLLIAVTLLSACQKEKDSLPPIDKPKTYSAEVIDKWLTMQIRLMRTTPGVPNHGFARHYAYTGIAVYESVKPGMPHGFATKHTWNGFSGLPAAQPGFRYYWPASANAALAAMNRAMFPTTSEANKAAIDSLENALSNSFQGAADADKIEKAAQFGKAVAAAVYQWAETDGYKNANNPYVPPVGAGLWEPTAPAFASPLTPYWGNNRPVIYGSTSNTMPAPPPAYSTDASSDFYQMVKQVHEASKTLTTEQKNMAIFWRDVPGVTSPGHWLSILQQVIRQKEAGMEKAAIAYALTGAAMNDALIACFKAKYHYNLVRPITYIRNVMAAGDWLPVIGTPAHPEYPSAHASLSAATAEAFRHLFGNIYFTDHTYDYLGLPARTYNSFRAIADDAGYSRFFAGIHYLPSIEAGLQQGRKVTANMFPDKYEHQPKDEVFQ